MTRQRKNYVKLSTLRTRRKNYVRLSTQDIALDVRITSEDGRGERRKNYVTGQGHDVRITSEDEPPLTGQRKNYVRVSTPGAT